MLVARQTQVCRQVTESIGHIIQRPEEVLTSQLPEYDNDIVISDIMKQEIKNRRLYAFFNSKVLNALLMVGIVCLLLMAYLKSVLLPALCGAIAFLFFIGYSLWFWIKKPKTIVINRRLSDVTGLYVLYDIITGATYPANQWLLIVPIALSVVVFAVSLLNNHDENFEI